MKRAKLLLLQVLVAVVVIVIWHLISATTLFGVLPDAEVNAEDTAMLLFAGEAVQSL